MKIDHAEKDEKERGKRKEGNLDDDEKIDELLFTVFELDGKDYGLGMQMLEEIVQDLSWYNVPGSPKNVLGATDIRGSVVPVLDIKRCLDLEVTDESIDKSLLVDIDGENLAIPVDKLKDIISADREQLVHPSKITNLSPENLQWIISLDDKRSIRVLDIRNIVDTNLKDKGLKDLKKKK